MKYSMCSTGVKDRPVEDVLAMAHELGLDGVELWAGHIDGFLAAGKTLSDLSDLLKEKNLTCIMVSPYLDLIDPSAQKENLELARKCITYANLLGSPMIRVWLGRKPSSMVTPAEWELCIRSLQLLAEEAEKVSVVLAIETHNDQPSDSPQALLDVLQKTARKAVKVIFDGFNMLSTEFDMMQTYEALKNDIVHVHLKNKCLGENRYVAMEDGDVDLKPVICALKRDGYTGYISFEFFMDELKTVEDLEDFENLKNVIGKSKEWTENAYIEAKP